MKVERLMSRLPKVVLKSLEKSQKGYARIFSVALVLLVQLSSTLTAEVLVSFNFDAAEATVDYLETGSPSDISSLLEIEGTQLLMQFNRARGMTPGKFKEALEKARESQFPYDEKCTRLKRIVDNLDAAELILAEIRKNASDYVAESVKRVLENVPDHDYDVSFVMYLVAGGRSDTYVVRRGDKMNLVLDLQSLIGPYKRGKLTEQLMGSLDHELHHVVIETYAKTRWEQLDLMKSQAVPAVCLTLLGEGYGHYMSIHNYELSLDHRASPGFSYEKYQEREAVLFALIDEKIHRFLATDDPQQQRNMIHESQTGDMWKKWGAMTGAFMIDRLISILGRDKMLLLIENNPYDWLLKYQQVAEENPEVHQLNSEFLDAVREVSRKPLMR